MADALREREDAHAADRRTLEETLAACHERALAAKDAAHVEALGALAADHDARLAEHVVHQALHLKEKEQESHLDHHSKLSAALRDRDEAHEMEKEELDLFLTCKFERELDARSSAYERDYAQKEARLKALEADLLADRGDFSSTSPEPAMSRAMKTRPRRRPALRARGPASRRNGRTGR